MQASSVARVLFDPTNPQAVSALDALQNLLYLIRLDAAHPELVRRYVDQAELVIKTQQLESFATEYPC